MFSLKTIEDILEEIKEDKSDNLSTTSFKMKRDIWEFFSNIPESKHYRAVEYGTHKGQTTRVLSHLFKYVYTINLPNHFDKAQELNADRDNIEYVGLDLYKQPEQTFEYKPVNVHFIDAGHSFNQVMQDVVRALKMESMNHLETGLPLPVYFIFDDYGYASDRGVYMAVNQLFNVGTLERVTYIGHPPRHSFGGNPERILADHEGIICKLVQHVAIL